MLAVLMLSSVLNSTYAQENIAPLGYNPVLQNSTSSKALKRTTAISLPFFDDFTNKGVKPDDSRWVDYQAYVNNTMCVDPISYGVATMDALNQYGYPYEAVNSNPKYADSLTSQQIDLSSNSPADSVYLSFFYQPQGNGFFPEPEDSLMLYLRGVNGWVQVWRTPGNTMQPFKQVMIPVKDTLFFHDEFQFRFINKATMVLNDDVWNIDYVRVDVNRSIGDTAVNDIAFSLPPSFMLNDYTFMPYHQFLVDANGERAANHDAYIRNNTSNAVNVNHSFTAREAIINSSLSSNLNNSQSLPPYSTTKVTYPMYTNVSTAPAKYHPVFFENKYYIESVSTTDKKENDTIVHEQHFHNYLAYDDGTAEKSYFLNLFPTLPGKTAIEFHLNEPDTLNGISIYFGRQLPLANNKYFSVAIYRDIAYNGGSDQLIYQEDFLNPVYSVVNHFWTYKFQQSVPLPAGTFYIGTIQPALSNSDSLYFGIDANRVGSNHLYYNVLNTWQSSTVSGALMVRPVFGPVFPSVISNTPKKVTTNWVITPNPATDFIDVNINTNKEVSYEVVNMQGQVLKRNVLPNNRKVVLSDLLPGVYYISLYTEGEMLNAPQKIIKY